MRTTASVLFCVFFFFCGAFFVKNSVDWSALWKQNWNIFILVSIKKHFVQIICFSWQAEYIIQHPQLLVPISSVHRGDRHEGCVYRAGMGVVSELHSSIVALEITVILRLLNPCVFGWAVSYMKKLQASLSRQSSQTGHKWKKMDQNKAGWHLNLGPQRKPKEEESCNHRNTMQECNNVLILSCELFKPFLPNASMCVPLLTRTSFVCICLLS